MLGPRSAAAAAAQAQASSGFHGCFRQWSQRPLTRDFTAVLAAQFQCIEVRTPFRFQAQ
jgi:hypothetical protein